MAKNIFYHFISLLSYHGGAASCGGISNKRSSNYHSLGCRWSHRPYFRALAATTGKYLGKAVVVVNRPGGGGAVGFTEAMQARPDGYTLVSAVTPLTILPHQVSTAFTYKSFDPVLNVVDDPSMFLVRSDAPWKSLKEFSGLCQEKP